MWKMLNIPDELLDAYAEELAITESSFEIMGQLLDQKHLKKRLDSLNVRELYIYGGGYLGIQFYRACENLMKVLSIVDKQRCLRLNIEDVPVIDLEGLKKVYKDEYIIITPVRYYQEIQQDLLSFVPKTKILFLGELMGGIL